MVSKCVPTLLVIGFGLLSSHLLHGQGPPPPPPRPPLPPLPNQSPAPAGNAITTAKINLGKVLFWDEQLSSTRTVSCGTCHQPKTGGSDPHSLLGDLASTHPGPDGIPGNADDITGSPGVIPNQADGTYALDDFFGMTQQVTRRYAPSVINAGFVRDLFWDGRATTQFRDPLTNNVVINAGAALESQAAGPPLSDVEMAHQSRDWNSVANRIEGVKPLAVASNIPAALQNWIANRNYPALFAEAFGDDAVTPARIVMAIATYERVLVSNQSPFDEMIGGDNTALSAAEQRGLAIFNGQGRCQTCHGGNRLTDDNFHYIGVRPQDDDLGRFGVTGNNQHRGQFKTPTLRNVELRGEYFHNGRFGTLAEVVAFYNRGGDFDAPNKNPNVRPLGLNAGQQADLVAFLSAPLTDPRVESETAPFDRPDMFADSAQVPTTIAAGVAGTAGITPSIVAIEPPLAGNPSFTIGVHSGLGGAPAVLVVDAATPPSGAGIPAANSVQMRFPLTLSGNGHGEGFGSIAIPMPDDFSGTTLNARWYVEDSAAPGGVSESESVQFTVFGSSAGTLPSPSNLTITIDSPTQTTVNWSAVAGAGKYQVFRGINGPISAGILVGETSLAQIVDTAFEQGTTSAYWVTAVGENEVVASESASPTQPEISIEEPISTLLTDGVSSTDFGTTIVGDSVSKTYTIRNTGSGSLSGLAATIGGDQSSDFEAGAIATTTLASGESTTFTVTFSPSADGARLATLQVVSNDTDESPFDISLTGNGSIAESLETWAATFGLSGNSALPTADEDEDGVSLLEEYTFNLNPTESDHQVLAPGTGTSGLPFPRFDENRLHLEYVRRIGDNSLTITPQFSGTLDVDGFTAATGTETVTPINDNYERVVISDTITTDTEQRRFGRLLIARVP